MTNEPRRLTAVIHGESGVGKSYLIDGMPGPRLIFDAEGGTDFTPSPKVAWTDLGKAPPDVDEDTTTVVNVREFQDLVRAYHWLNSGKHPFRSVAMDSITEIQKKCKDTIGAREAFDQRMWGVLLDRMEGCVRDFRDLKKHPIKPLDCVVIVALSHERSGKIRPNVQGQLASTLPGFMDIVGYMYNEVTVEDESVASMEVVRKLLTAPIDNFTAKDRTGRLGIGVTNPSFTKIFDTVFGE